jgi:prepilin-type N-terminal cleavage/methylation domain-containing protein
MFAKYIRQDRAGFTLLEIMIALIIFSVGILGVASMQGTSILGNSKGRFISETTNITAGYLEDFLDRVKKKQYDDPALTDTDNNGAAGLDEQNAPDHGPITVDGYTLVWNVAEGSPFSGTKTIRIFATSPGGITNVSMDYMLANLGN